MRDSGIAMMFSGQGRFRPESLDSLLRIQPTLQQVFDDIGAANGHQLGKTLAALTSCHILRRSELLSHLTSDQTAMLIYGISVATCRHLLGSGWQPKALMGQSFGEIPALVSSRVCSVSEGATIVQARSMSIGLLGGGGCMAVLETGADDAQQTIFHAGSKHVVIAAENSTSETVISGARSEVQKVLDHAARAGIASKFLKTAAALHNPALTREIADVFYREIARLPWQSATIPIFSPSLGRFYEPDEDPARILSEGLTRPLFLSRAFPRLHAAGITTVIECAPLQGSERYVAGLAGSVGFVSQRDAIESAARSAHPAAITA